MRFNPLIPELTVADLERTKAFYIDLLRFEVEYERPEDHFVFLSLEGNQMMFEQGNGSWATAALEYPLGRGVNFEMTVSDVEGLYHRVTDAGITPFREMAANTYRCGNEDVTQREFLVQDPDGYLLRFTD